MEVELQYLYRSDSAPLVPIELAGFALAGSTSFGVLDTYYDTSRLDLRRAGCSLRVRQAENLAQPYAIWKGPATRRPDGAKEREELELELDHVPRDGRELQAALDAGGAWARARRAADLDGRPELHAIGQLRNDRSAHVYAQGLHRLELTWDRLTYPIGPPETRMEVEARTAPAARFLAAVDEELRALFGDALVPAPQGKSRELCERLYPELLAA